MKEILKRLGVLIIVIAMAGWYPFCLYYQDAVYDAEWSVYEAEKYQFDSLQTFKLSQLEDSLFSVWKMTNDTTVRSIKKISTKTIRTPDYCETGYERKTGKWICHNQHNGDLLCEPQTEWITTDYYRCGYNTEVKTDTIWTPGYQSREDWINEAHRYAHENAVKVKTEFKPYTGHEFHYLIKMSNEKLNLVGFVCSAAFSIVGFYCLSWVISAIIAFIKYKQ